MMTSTPEAMSRPASPGSFTLQATAASPAAWMTPALSGEAFEARRRKPR